MHFRGIWILMLTLLLCVTVSQTTLQKQQDALIKTNSSFNTCYFTDRSQSSQCPWGQSCTIVPPENMKVRRRASYPEQDEQLSEETWFTLGETRRKGGKGGGRGGRGGRGRRGGRRSWRGSSRRSLPRTGTHIPKLSYGRTVMGVTSAFVGFGAWYWLMSKSSEYYRWRRYNRYNNNMNLLKNQGICMKKENLRLMTREDCYNWCMSDIYNDNICAHKCGLEKKETIWDSIERIIMDLLPYGIVFLCCSGLVFFLRKQGFIGGKKL